MRKNNHSYIPVLAEGRILSIFSQKTLFMRMAEENGLLLHEDTDPEGFEDCLGLEAHESESFGFIHRQATVVEAEEKFSGPQCRRLEALFVTENGTPGEKVLGMTTRWDLTKYRADHNGWI